MNGSAATSNGREHVRHLATRWPSGLAAFAVAGLLAVIVGTSGILAGLVVVAAWAALPATIGVAVTTVSAATVLHPGHPEIAVIAVAVLAGGVLVELVDRDWPASHVAVVTVAGVAAITVAFRVIEAGTVSGALALGVATGTATLMYALHRYALVRTEALPDGD